MREKRGHGPMVAKVIPPEEIYKHYCFRFAGITFDPYRLLDLYKITHPAQQHAIKKLLRAGQSHKDLREDVKEARDTLTRWLNMMAEDDIEAERVANEP